MLKHKLLDLEEENDLENEEKTQALTCCICNKQEETSPFCLVAFFSKTKSEQIINNFFVNVIIFFLNFQILTI